MAAALCFRVIVTGAVRVASAVARRDTRGLATADLTSAATWVSIRVRGAFARMTGPAPSSSSDDSAARIVVMLARALPPGLLLKS